MPVTDTDLYNRCDNNMTEIWKDMDGLKGSHQINQSGVIKSLARTVIRKNGVPNRVLEKLIKRKVHSSGYVILNLNHFGKVVSCRLHRLLAEAFIPNPKNLPDVNHIDGNKANNELSNLEWTSTRENSVHGFLRKKKSSKYPGVSWKSSRSTWCAFIKVNGRQINLGSFLNEEEAHKAYLDAHRDFCIENKYAA